MACGCPEAYLGVSSNGSAAGTGIVWALVPANGDGNSCRGVKGMLIAFDAEDVTKESGAVRAKMPRLPTPRTASVSCHVSIRLRSRTEKSSWVRREMRTAAALWRSQTRSTGPANYYLAVYGLR